MNKLGRRISLASSLLLCGVTCIAGGFVPEKVFWVQICLFLVGKMAITSSFAIGYVYSGDWRIYLWPTRKRSNLRFTSSRNASNADPVWWCRNVIDIFTFWCLACAFCANAEIHLRLPTLVAVWRCCIHFWRACVDVTGNAWAKAARHNWRSWKHWKSPTRGWRRVIAIKER